ncbi:MULTISPECIES: RNA 3'-terminal phosphate cyclase [Methylomonas]|uniref:RNA 3'-terminal phosphate cyclase n=1 Tax=Methylomonas koyamae TaxID=702114 RepID=A0A177P0G2_9GAMM|nr:RNA 3'-terminal phosphate cyclase [Methylomonas koyamae]OAI23786.1 RNA 3'-phosphate cyclase [Methylomonas koyamae]
MTNNIIELDGSQGEGGGQILRSALSLAMCMGTPIHIKNIRAKRKKPGLMRQHLTAVQAATEISGATVEGAFAGSTELKFAPSAIQGGDYRFSIGTAGSCTLVLQTILPALLMASRDSRITLSGGTHNSMSPPFHFLERAFVPLLARMGAKVELQLNRFGFYPAGGGEITMQIKAGNALTPLHLESRGQRVKAYAESFFAGLPAHIAERELAVVKKRMAWGDDQLIMRGLNRDQGPGNVLLISLEYEQVTEVFSGFGEKGVSAESVANGAVKAAHDYLSGEAAVSSYLADQLLLPMVLAGGGTYTATDWSLHAETNADIIQRFLTVDIQTEKTTSGDVRVTLTAKR